MSQWKPIWSAPACKRLLLRGDPARPELVVIGSKLRADYDGKVFLAEGWGDFLPSEWRPLPGDDVKGPTA